MRTVAPGIKIASSARLATSTTVPDASTSDAAAIRGTSCLRQLIILRSSRAPSTLRSGALHTKDAVPANFAKICTCDKNNHRANRCQRRSDCPAATRTDTPTLTAKIPTTRCRGPSLIRYTDTCNTRRSAPAGRRPIRRSRGACGSQPESRCAAPWALRTKTVTKRAFDQVVIVGIGEWRSMSTETQLDRTGAATIVTEHPDQFRIAVDGKTVGVADYHDRDGRRIFRTPRCCRSIAAADWRRS